MGDEIEAITEGAKAVQEVAKTTSKALDATQAGGAYLARMLGTVLEDAVGLLGGDLLRQYRIRNWHRISQKTFDKLDQRGVEQVEPLSAKVIVPLLEAASNESDETLQEMWANLLANAMDPNKDTSLQSVFIETLKQFEPIDALVLDAAVKKFRDKMFGGGATAELISKRSSLASISAEHLAKLGCFLSDSRTVAAPERKRNYSVSNLGTELHLACTGDAPD